MYKDAFEIYVYENNLVKESKEYYEIAKIVASKYKNPLEELCISHLKLVFDGTESGPFKPYGYNKSYDEDAFGEINSKDHCYMIYFNSLVFTNNNGDTLDVNRAYSSGHIEFYHGKMVNLQPNQKQIEILKEIAQKMGYSYRLEYSLRAKGSWAETFVKWKDE